MMSYKHFTLEERKCLQEFLDKGKSLRYIANAIGRSPSSVSREIRRNQSKHKSKKVGNEYRYHHWRANILTIERRRRNERRAIISGSEAWEYIIEKLKLFWSPETICATWNKAHPDGPKLNHSTIYRYIKEGRFPGISRSRHLRRRGKLKRSRKTACQTIHPDRRIPDWPEEIRNRSRIGDWEGDTVYGGIGKGLLVTLVDRKTRYLVSTRVNSRDASEVKTAIVHLLSGLPVHSISLDNGSEFAAFHEIESSLNAQVYFAEPHKPWQRGTNENTNDILRFFFPKGYDFLSLDDDDLDFVLDLINARPRKCLDWLTPSDVFSVALH